MTYTMDLDRPKKNQSNRRDKFHSRTKNKVTFFTVLATKPVEIVFVQPIDNIK